MFSAPAEVINHPERYQKLLGSILVRKLDYLRRNCLNLPPKDKLTLYVRVTMHRGGRGPGNEIELSCEAAHFEFSWNGIILGENLRDAQFYELIGRWWCAQHRTGDLMLACDKRQGGGSALITVARQLASEQHQAALAVVDSDRHYEGDPAQEHRAVLAKWRYQTAEYPLLRWYVLDEVSEVENLLPRALLREAYGNKEFWTSGIREWRWFDFKKGVKILSSDTGSAYARFWREQLNSSLLQVRADSITLEGIGNNTLQRMLPRMESLLAAGAGKTTLLLDAVQLSVWERLGQEIFSICCCDRKLLSEEA